MHRLLDDILNIERKEDIEGTVEFILSVVLHAKYKILTTIDFNAFCLDVESSSEIVLTLQEMRDRETERPGTTQELLTMTVQAARHLQVVRPVSLILPP